MEPDDEALCLAIAFLDVLGERADFTAAGFARYAAEVLRCHPGGLGEHRAGRPSIDDRPLMGEVRRLKREGLVNPAHVVGIVAGRCSRDPLIARRTAKRLRAKLNSR